MFARVLGGDCVVAIAPRLACTLMAGETLVPIGEEVWSDTRVALSSLPVQRAWHDALTGAQITPHGGLLPASSALAILPVAMLVSSAD